MKKRKASSVQSPLVADEGPPDALRAPKKRRRGQGKAELGNGAVVTEVKVAGTAEASVGASESSGLTLFRRKTGPVSGSVASPKLNSQVDKNTGSPLSTSSGLFQVGTTFAKLGLAPWLVSACENMGMNYPTDIQAMSIPHVLAGKNVAGNAKTGSGKTACFCLPSLHHLSKDPYGIFILVVTPVRELSFQIAENYKALGVSIGVEVTEVVGGRDMMHQSKMISARRHVIVATPGRLADLLRGDPDLAQAFRRMKTFVLDEADQLLTPTFEEPLAEIISAIPKERQTLLFSATITQSIERLKSGMGGNGKELMLIDANPADESLENLTQQYVFVPQTVQICYLHYLLNDHFYDESVIVFAPTIDLCQLLTSMLEILEFPVTGLHSLQSQRERQASLGKFRSGRCTILLATDVASRGLDIPKVGVIIMVGLPKSTDDFVHRSGRTARAGRPGLVVSLMSERDVQKVGAIEERLGRKLELRETNEEAALKLLSKTTKARQRADLLLSEVGFEDKLTEHRGRRSSRKDNRGGRSAVGTSLVGARKGGAAKEAAPKTT
eukprot:TRINITY_DN51666_c0_g1_i1.p1 TRINITY_DN51666_c0_g1~~TRINITY_DN51666_c0_g1_i1.p1  ORF type:complete len:554 (-),score=93.77 TRINITY_DN51666_c0_g1_i1:23-1684(-)